MGYRAFLEATPETVQDLELAARRRLDEAMTLYIDEWPHTAIYLAGLAAEMYLKTACFFVEGAKPADPIAVHLTPLKAKSYRPPFRADFESGHGIWFWSQELIARRERQKLHRVPRRFLAVAATIYTDWFVGMRYRPGFATSEDASRFITQVEWLANNHSLLRR